jgi:hypothetical protein
MKNDLFGHSSVYTKKRAFGFHKKIKPLEVDFMLHKPG